MFYLSLLARNLPPAISCDRCGKPAYAVVAGYSRWRGYEAVCEACIDELSRSEQDTEQQKSVEVPSTQHSTPANVPASSSTPDEEDEDFFEDDDLYYEEGLVPIVNSPRMGVCGYTGGTEYVIIHAYSGGEDEEVVYGDEE